MTERLRADQLIDRLPRGEKVFVGGSSGEPTALLETLVIDPERSRGLELLTTFVPGVNPLAIDDLHPTARVSGLFMTTEWSAAQAAGRYRHLPISYAGLLKHLRGGPPLGALVLQVAPPDAGGQCSLGPAVEFAPEALRGAKRLFGVINHATPKVRGAPSVSIDRFDAVMECDRPLRTYSAGPVDGAPALAANAAPFICDGAALQVGLGKAPQALLSSLTDRRNLRLQSGMLPDGIMALAEAGALDPDWHHTACAALGASSLYDWLADRPDMKIAGCEETHALSTLAAVEGLVAVNTALEVDLFGQANLELAAGRAVSGPGGAPDFARGARLSPGGVSIVALPATAGSRSRIRPQLTAPGLATLGRSDIDVIATEHGAADLRGRSTRERAEAIIDLAAPASRGELRDAWRDLGARL